MQITSTKNYGSQRLKLCVYGDAGVGKTRLCATTGAPTLILSAESGLLSLQGHDIPVIVINNINDLRDAYNYLANEKEAEQYEWICIDSLSEVAELCLTQKSSTLKNEASSQGKKGIVNYNKLQAYGLMQEHMTALIKAFRQLDKNIYMSAKADKIHDETVGVIQAPSLPGKKLGLDLPYMFDEILYLNRRADGEGNVKSYIQTFRDGKVEAKDRSGKLPKFCEPSLATIHKLICGEKDGQETENN